MPFWTYNELAKQLEYTIPQPGGALKLRYTYRPPRSYDEAYGIIRSMLLHNPEVTREELEHAVVFVESFVPKK